MSWKGFQKNRDFQNLEDILAPYQSANQELSFAKACEHLYVFLRRKLIPSWNSLWLRVANLAFLKPDFEILAFSNALDKIWLFFSRKGLTLTEHCVTCISITKSLWLCRVQRILQRFYFALKMFNVFHKTQMYDRVITGKENASKDWNCIISMFLTSFNIYFVFGCACFMCICRKTAICSFWDKIWLFWRRQVGNPG